MKLKRLQVEGYKNVRSCDIEFTQSPLINAVNGSGKSNLIEAIIQILNIAADFRNSAPINTN